MSTLYQADAEMSLRLQRHFALIAAAVILLLASTNAWASDGTEFSGAVTKWEQWINGNWGKLAALVCLAAGLLAAAIKKDWSWMLGSIVLAMGTGIIVGIINASFTATIEGIALNSNNLSHHIPAYLDSAPKFLFWDLDVAMVALMGAVCGVGSGYPIFGLCFGVALAYGYIKLKAGQHPGMAIHLTYWFTGLPDMQALPKSHLRELNG